MSAAHKDPAAAQILVVEDSSVFREMQGLLLRQAGYGAWLYESPQAALGVAATQHFDLVVIDYELPEMNGAQFMQALRGIQPDVAVVFVSGTLTLELAIALSNQGVAGIFHKPVNPKTLLEKINETLSRAARDTAVRAGSVSPLAGTRPAAVVPPAPEPAADQLAYEPRYVFGASDPFREFTHRLRKVRDFRAVLLLQGEPGSPFELFARELAGISVFRDGPVMVCPAADFEPRRLIEALAPSLLSHDPGTLIVTDVEELTAAQQRTLENLITGRDVFLPFARRFRIVLATAGQLADRVDAGTFGETLFYKISSLSLAVPTLREMRDDIVLNVRHILEQHQQTADANAPTTLAPDAIAWVEGQDWPGNYAQLHHFVLLATRHAAAGELDAPALEAALHEYQGEPAAEPSPAASPATPSAAADPVPAHRAVDVAPPAAISIAPEESGRQTGAAPRVLTTASLFRPASQAYRFGQRLAESIALAGANRSS